MTPRALQLEEMPYVVGQFVRGAKNALDAGFDGVEVHGANGYLLDQFLQTANNRRIDDYGGSVENRARLLLDVIVAVNEVWDSDRVGVRLSPLGTFNDMADDDPEATFGYIVERLNEYDLAYLHVVRPGIQEAESGSWDDPEAQSMMQLIRGKYKGTLIVAGGFDRDEGEEWVLNGKADLIAFGRKFLANPDLPQRFQLGVHLNADDATTYYGGGAFPDGFEGNLFVCDVVLNLVHRAVLTECSPERRLTPIIRNQSFLDLFKFEYLTEQMQ